MAKQIQRELPSGSVAPRARILLSLLYLSLFITLGSFIAFMVINRGGFGYTQIITPFCAAQGLIFTLFFIGFTHKDLRQLQQGSFDRLFYITRVIPIIITFFSALLWAADLILVLLAVANLRSLSQFDGDVSPSTQKRITMGTIEGAIGGVQMGITLAIAILAIVTRRLMRGSGFGSKV